MRRIWLPRTVRFTTRPSIFSSLIDPQTLSTFAVYDADTATVSAGKVTNWDNKASPGTDDIETIGGDPDYTATNSGFNNLPTVDFSLGRTLRTADADKANWKFLHDDTTSWSMWFVGELTGNTVPNIFQTNRSTSGNVGFGIYGDLTNGYVYSVISESGLSNPLLRGRSAKGSLDTSKSIWVAVWEQGKGLTIRVNGIEVYTDGMIGSVNTSNPFEGLLVSYLSDGSFGEFGFVKSAFSNGQAVSIENFLADKYDITISRPSFHHAIFYCGNSLVGSSPAYPDNVKALLSTTNVTEKMLGISGQTTTQMLTRDVARVDAFIDTTASTNVCVFTEAINDVSSGKTISEALTNVQTWAAARRAAGFIVVIESMLPTSFVSNTDRATYNAALVSGEGVWFDALADVHTDTTIGQDGQNVAGTYYSDTTHTTAAGDAIRASYVSAAINSVIQ